MVCRPQSAMHDSKTGSRLSVGASTVVAALLVTVGAAQTDMFADVMRRAHEYVVVYEDHLMTA